VGLLRSPRAVRPRRRGRRLGLRRGFARARWVAQSRRGWGSRSGPSGRESRSSGGRDCGAGWSEVACGQPTRLAAVDHQAFGGSAGSPPRAIHSIARRTESGRAVLRPEACFAWPWLHATPQEKKDPAAVSCHSRFGLKATVVRHRLSGAPRTGSCRGVGQSAGEQTNSGPQTLRKGLCDHLLLACAGWRGSPGDPSPARPGAGKSGPSPRAHGCWRNNGHRLNYARSCMHRERSNSASIRYDKAECLDKNPLARIDPVHASSSLVVGSQQKDGKQRQMFAVLIPAMGVHSLFLITPILAWVMSTGLP